MVTMKKKIQIIYCLLIKLHAIPLVLLTLVTANCQEKVPQSTLPSIEYTVTTEINYAGNKDMAQTMDIYVPLHRKSEKLPVIVTIFGAKTGLWGKGDKMWGGDSPFLSYLLDGNYACVKINYRLSTEAQWPAQLYDCKAAIRWIKANADRFGFDKDKIAVEGELSGGHLALMLALTSNDKSLEGDVGNYLNENSKINCIVSGFAPTNLEELGGKEVETLLGGTVDKLKKEASEASPINWVTNATQFPIYLYQGDAEEKVPMAQTDLLYNALKEAQFKDIYYQKITNGSKRNLELWNSPKVSKSVSSAIEDFYKKYLLKQDIQIEVSELSVTPQQKK
jgi:acetyl esterase/lipase